MVVQEVEVVMVVEEEVVLLVMVEVEVMFRIGVVVRMVRDFTGKQTGVCLSGVVALSGGQSSYGLRASLSCP